MNDIAIFLSEETIMMNYDSKSQKNALEIISKKMSALSSTNADEIFEKLYEREKLGTTAFGNGFAIPHARVKGIEEAKVIVLKLNNGIDFNSVDDSKVDVIISLLAPDDENDLHIELLSYIAKLLDSQIIREKIRSAESASDIIRVIRDS